MGGRPIGVFCHLSGILFISGLAGPHWAAQGRRGLIGGPGGERTHIGELLHEVRLALTGEPSTVSLETENVSQSIVVVLCFLFFRYPFAVVGPVLRFSGFPVKSYAFSALFFRVCGSARVFTSAATVTPFVRLFFSYSSPDIFDVRVWYL